jgi:hypothetical protein
VEALAPGQANKTRVPVAGAKDNKQIAAELRTSHVTVEQWCQRVLEYTSAAG